MLLKEGSAVTAAARAAVAAAAVRVAVSIRSDDLLGLSFKSTRVDFKITPLLLVFIFVFVLVVYTLIASAISLDFIPLFRWTPSNFCYSTGFSLEFIPDEPSPSPISVTSFKFFRMSHQ